jgi:NADH-quinone oxidoreductase subunit N
MSAAQLSVLILVIGAAVALLLTGLLSSRPRLTSVVGVPFTLVAAVVGLQAPPPYSLAVIGLCLIATLALLLLPAVRPEVPAHVAEATALLLLGTGGAVALATGTDLLQVVVGLETLALSAVILVALSGGERPLEAAFKYFVLGAISLSALLYGLGLIYLTTGSFNFPSAPGNNPMTLVGIVLVALGITFELAMFPFHWGALDAYTAAAPPLAGYVMSASKLAAAYALGRLVVGSGGTAAQVLIWGGSLTILWGTFGALAQGRNVRRLLAYSAVTHAGFIALAAGSGPDGPTVAAFYAALYGSMAMLVFAALAGTPSGDTSTLGPLRAGALALGLFSLSGIPPTPGFWAKLSVLVVAWQFAGPLPTLIAVLGGVFSVLYYLRPIPDLFAVVRERVPALGMVAPVAGVLLAGALVVFLGIFPGVPWALAAAR